MLVAMLVNIEDSKEGEISRERRIVVVDSRGHSMWSRSVSIVVGKVYPGASSSTVLMRKSRVRH